MSLRTLVRGSSKTGTVVSMLFYASVISALVLVGRGTAAREVAKLLPNLLMLFKGLIGDPAC